MNRKTFIFFLFIVLVYFLQILDYKLNSSSETNIETKQEIIVYKCGFDDAYDDLKGTLRHSDPIIEAVLYTYSCALWIYLYLNVFSLGITIFFLFVYNILNYSGLTAIRIFSLLQALLIIILILGREFLLFASLAILIAFISFQLLIAIVVDFINLIIGNDPIYTSLSVFFRKEKKVTFNERVIKKITESDPNFSYTLFIDFVSNVIYNSLYLANKKHLLDQKVKPFLSVAAYKKILERFGSKKIFMVNIADIDFDREIESNHRKIILNVVVFYKTFEKVEDKIYLIKETFTIDRLIFERDFDLSLSPDKLYVLSCPYCGAPGDFDSEGKCNYCGRYVVPGKSQWYLSSIENIEQKVDELGKVKEIVPEEQSHLIPNLIKINQLNPDVYFKVQNLEDLIFYKITETMYPTEVSVFLPERILQFEKKYNVRWAVYSRKFLLDVAIKYFKAINKAWNTLEWDKVRHLLSDRAWENWKYIIDFFKSNNLKNYFKAKIIQVFIKDLTMDRFYDTIVVRFLVTYKQTVIVKHQEVKEAGLVSLPYIERWTFVRYAGMEKEKKYNIYTCPACGAPSEKISEEGICEYCGAKVTNGQFYWVLSSVEYEY